MIKAVIYARVSTAKQTEGTSLESQIEACKKYAKENGIRVGEEVREVGSGGTLVERQQLDNIRRGIRNGIYSHIICYAVDRLSRSVSHLFILLDECDRFGVNVCFVTESLDNSPEGKLLQSVKGYVAEVEREKIRERTMRGRKTHANNGTLKFRRKLYGYQVIDERRVIDDTQASHVRFMFDNILAGKSLRATAHSLNARGIPTPNGSVTWWANTILSIVSNPGYYGNTVAFRYSHEIKYVDGRKLKSNGIVRPEKDWIELPGVTPPIVTEEVWQAAQNQLQINKKEKRREVKHEFLLRGFITCVNCGRKFHPHQTRTYRRYSCTSIQNPSVNCHTKALNADKAEEAVWIEVLKIISGLTIPEPPAEPKQDALPAVERQIRNLEKEMCLIVERSATSDKRAWDIFQQTLERKASELEKLEVHRESIIKERSTRPRSMALKDIQKQYRKTISNLPFEQRVDVLKNLGLRCTWDGTELKINIYAR